MTFDFPDLSLPVIAVCAAAVFGGGLVKGVTGIGLPLVAMPILAGFIPIPQAIALLSLSSVATSLMQGVHGGHFMTASRRFWPLFAGIFAGVFASAWTLVVIDLQMLYLLLGAVVVGFASILQRRIVFTVTPAAEIWAAPATGFVAGLIGGVSMLFGPIYAMYMSGLRLPKDIFVVGVSLANLVSTIVLVVALAGYQLINSGDLLASVLAMIPAFAGVLLGQRLRHRINEDAFRKALAVVLLLIGLNLVRKALM